MIFNQYVIAGLAGPAFIAFLVLQFCWKHRK